MRPGAQHTPANATKPPVDPRNASAASILPLTQTNGSSVPSVNSENVPVATNLNTNVRASPSADVSGSGTSVNSTAAGNDRNSPGYISLPNQGQPVISNNNVQESGSSGNKGKNEMPNIVSVGPSATDSPALTKQASNPHMDSAGHHLSGKPPVHTGGSNVNSGLFVNGQEGSSNINGGSGSSGQTPNGQKNNSGTLQKRKSRFEVKDVPSGSVRGPVVGGSSGQTSENGGVPQTGAPPGTASKVNNEGKQGSEESGGTRKPSSGSGGGSGGNGSSKGKSRFEVKDVDPTQRTPTVHSVSANVGLNSATGGDNEESVLPRSETPSIANSTDLPSGPASPSPAKFAELLLAELRIAILNLVEENEALKQENAVLRARIGISGNEGGNANKSGETAGGSFGDGLKLSAAANHPRSASANELSSTGLINSSNVDGGNIGLPQSISATQLGSHTGLLAHGGNGWFGQFGSGIGDGYVTNGVDRGDKSIAIGGNGSVGQAQQVSVALLQAQAQRSAVSQCVGYNGGNGSRAGHFSSGDRGGNGGHNEATGHGLVGRMLNSISPLGLQGEAQMMQRPTHVSSPSRVSGLPPQAMVAAATLAGIGIGAVVAGADVKHENTPVAAHEAATNDSVSDGRFAEKRAIGGEESGFTPSARTNLSNGGTPSFEHEANSSSNGR